MTGTLAGNLVIATAARSFCCWVVEAVQSRGTSNRAHSNLPKHGWNSRDVEGLILWMLAYAVIPRCCMILHHSIETHSVSLDCTPDSAVVGSNFLLKDRKPKKRGHR